MINTMILSKEATITYLLNELGSMNYEVSTVLNDNGCWTGEVRIKATNAEENCDTDYFKLLAES